LDIQTNHNSISIRIYLQYIIYNIYDIYIIRMIESIRMRWAGYVARKGETSNAYRLLVRKPEGKRPIGRPRRRWAYNIKMDVLQIGWGGVDWIGLPQDRDKWRALVNAVMKLQVLQNAGKLSSSYTTGGLSSNAQLHRVSYIMHEELRT
jgi:hypothetical protein